MLAQIESPASRFGTPGNLLRNAIVAAAYVAAAKVGFFLAFFNSQVSPIWPPEGVALAALLVWGRFVLPGILLGAFLANFLNNPHIPTAVMIGIGNSAGAALNMFLILSLCKTRKIFSSSRVLFRYFISIVPGSALSASVGVSALWLYGFVPGPDYPETWTTWFAGELQGFLIVAPFLITWSAVAREIWEPKKIVEGLLLVLALVATSYFAFSRNYPISYIPIPFVVLLALRFGEFGATLGMAIVSALAVLHTVGGRGPFAMFGDTGDFSRNDTLVLLDLFLFIITVTAYTLVTVARERHAAIEESLNSLITIEKVKDQANRELEAKVIERTRIIGQQKQELEDQIAIAEKIQMSLLPTNVSKVENCVLDFRYQPMMKIGGDFIDVKYNASNHSLGMFICDVSGHGVAAAFLSVMVKMALSQWYSNLSDVTGALNFIHESLAANLGDNFVTATILHLNTETGELRVASAGHHPTIIVHKDGTHDLIKPHGRMIMSFRDPMPKEIVTKLTAGDRLILFTDGLTEARIRNGSLVLDEASLIAMVAESKEAIPELCGNIFNHVLSGSGGADSIEDDISLLLLEYQGAAVKV
ncbi:MAG: SpoIIE family protein phosphatase [Leptospirales bacterium]|nr:SpoIIE family protein phosphatase [Leptospirales bacterium]